MLVNELALHSGAFVLIVLEYMCENISLLPLPFNRLYVFPPSILQDWSIFALENYELSSIYVVSFGKIKLFNHILFRKEMSFLLCF
jgi:hypothetical protein